MATTTLEAGLAPFYEAFFADPIYEAFYGGTGYANFGYWKADTRTAAEASDNLVDAIVDQLPHAAETVLDVGCGQGATTRRLLKYFDATDITAVNIDPAQVEAARDRLPEVEFHVMDATNLSFEDEAFDNVVSVEAAFHFRTRKKFFHEAFRVLKPGGGLALSDLLMARGAPMAPAENHIRGATAYATLLAGAGFSEVKIQDVTDITWRAYRRRFTEFLSRDAGRALSMTGLRDLYVLNVNSAWAIRGCYLVSARKPQIS